MPVQTEAYVMLSMVLFVLGAMGVLLRRNAILVFMSVELMLNAANLAMVAFAPDGTHRVRYLRQPFRREPDFGVTSVNYDFAELLARAEAPK